MNEDLKSLAFGKVDADCGRCGGPAGYALVLAGLQTVDGPPEQRLVICTDCLRQIAGYLYSV